MSNYDLAVLAHERFPHVFDRQLVRVKVVNGIIALFASTCDICDRWLGDDRRVLWLQAADYKRPAGATICRRCLPELETPSAHRRDPGGREAVRIILLRIAIACVWGAPFAALVAYRPEGGYHHMVEAALYVQAALTCIGMFLSDTVISAILEREGS